MVGVQLKIHNGQLRLLPEQRPLLRSLTIGNETDERLRDVEVVVRCEPEFAKTIRLKFERLDARETRRLDALDLKFRHRYHADLNEAERDRVVVQVNRSGAEIARVDHAVDLLAYGQWASTRALPERLTAFSLPNNRAIGHLTFQASTLLAGSRFDSALVMVGW